MTVSHLLDSDARLERESAARITCDSCHDSLDVEAERPADAGWRQETDRGRLFGGGSRLWICPVCQRRRAENHSLEDWA